MSLFFFQAEDGIRDKLVTGVQTCALPISVIALLAPAESSSGTATIGSASYVVLPPGIIMHSGALLQSLSSQSASRSRSEERRVGKEGSTGRSHSLREPIGVPQLLKHFKRQ